ncbi:MAG: DoxX protein [Candidatus Omnitrophota bacterium]
MKVILRTAQVVMGVIFLVMGINGFVQFIPLPEKGPEAQAFLGALEQAGYFWPFEKGCEILFGGLLLINRFVIFAIKGLASIIANIILFHIFLDPRGAGLAVVVLVCEAILVIGHWKTHFAPLFKMNSHVV